MSKLCPVLPQCYPQSRVFQSLTEDSVSVTVQKGYPTNATSTMVTKRNKIKFLFVLAVGCIFFYRFQSAKQTTRNSDSGRSLPIHVALNSALRSDVNLTRTHKLKQPTAATKDRQTERKLRVREFCKGMGYTSTEPIWKNIAVFTYHKILYCVTPKCASRQWRRLLVSGYPHHGPGGVTLERFPDDQRELMIKTFFKFTVVREPFERLLSAYKDKFLFPRKEDARLLQLYAEKILRNSRPFKSILERGYDNIHKITFQEFIEYLVTHGSNETTEVMDRHWDNYANICGMCAIDYDFIAHYETLEEDLAAFKEATKDRKYKDSIKVNPFNSGVIQPSNTHSELIKYYSPIPLEWIRTLGEIYKSSFEMFGYSFPGPLRRLFEAKKLRVLSV